MSATHDSGCQATDDARLRLVCLMTHNRPGGAQNALLRLAEEFVRRGHDVAVWPLYGAPADTGHMAHCRVVWPEASPGLFAYARMTVRLVRRLRSLRPDAVISFMPIANTLGQLAARIAGVPGRVASQRNPCWTYQPIMQVCDRIVGSLGVYTRVVANSDSVRQSFAAYPRAYVRRLIVVYNGITWQPSPLDRDAARARFGLPENAPVVANVGRLAEQKNHAFLLSVLARLPRVHLAIAGDGELREALRVQAADLKISDRVHILGHLDRPAIADLLAASDVFAQPSFFEGQSNALLEAMSAGLAIVASDIAPQAETLRGSGPEPAGLLLPLHDETAWVETLGAILRDSDLGGRLAARARTLAAEFTMERMADGFEAAIRRPIRDATGLHPRLAESLDQHPL